jgi:hypothetical protein
VSGGCDAIAEMSATVPRRGAQGLRIMVRAVRPAAGEACCR